MESVEKRGVALSVVVPAFNEERRLTRTLEATVAYLDGRGEPYELLVVDDGSSDRTAAVVTEWATARGASDRVRALRYEPNRGKGHAVRYGVLRAAASERILFMDADLATPIEELEKLEAALDPEHGVCYAIGSRPLRESQLVVRQPWYREISGRAFNKAVRLAATPGIADTQCGFKLLTADAGRAIFSRCVLDGFSFDVEAIFVARKLGYTVAEGPVRWAHQEGAAAFPSKLAYLKQGLRMLSDLRRIRWAHRALRPGTSAPRPSGVAAPAPAAGPTPTGKPPA
jgi:dolichyl-phosphate beta-glucosyltransferase